MAIDLLNLGTVANDRTGDTWRAGGTKINSMMTELYSEILDTLVVVKQASDLAGTLDSTKEYFIDGIVDLCADYNDLKGSAELTNFIKKAANKHNILIISNILFIYTLLNI